MRAEEMGDPLPEGAAAGIKETHSPFTECCRRVTGGLGNFGNRDGFVGKWKLSFRRDFIIASDGAMNAMQAGEERTMKVARPIAPSS